MASGAPTNRKSTASSQIVHDRQLERAPCCARAISPAEAECQCLGGYGGLGPGQRGSAEELQSAIDITLQRLPEYQSLQGAFGRRASSSRRTRCVQHAIDADRAIPDAAGALTAERPKAGRRRAGGRGQPVAPTHAAAGGTSRACGCRTAGWRAWFYGVARTPRWSAPFQPNSGRRRASPRGRHVATSVGTNGGEECIEPCGRDTDRGVGCSVVEPDLPRLRVVHESAREHGVGYVALAFVRGGRP